MRILTVVSLLAFLAVFATAYKFPLKSSTVKALGSLIVDFHVPIGDPIFVVTNMAPGDMEDRDIDVTNSGSDAILVAVKGIRTGGVGDDPKLETVLDIVIKDGSTPVYGSGSPTGAKTLADFFNDSTSADGVALSLIGPGEHKVYNFKVTFPPGAGNEFQAKSVIFDLIFGSLIEQEGTIGFWRNWNRHNTYSQGDINGWMSTINTASAWLINDWKSQLGIINTYDIDTTGLVNLIKNSTSCRGNQRSCSALKFKAQYLALRLNVASGRKSLAHIYNVSSLPSGAASYLGLSGPTTSLGNIITAIEGKAIGVTITNPTRNQLLLMMGVCDFINNQGI